MPQNRHRDIYETLKRAILDGKYEAGKPLPSAPALMKKFGVARATAVAALKALEREGLAKSVRGSGTYPVKRDPITFGVIVPEAGRPFYACVCEGIAKFANNAGGGGVYSLLWCASRHDSPATGGPRSIAATDGTEPVRLRTSQIRAFARMCVEAHVAGVFFQTTRDGRLTRELLTLFRDAKIPVVLLGGEVPPVGCPCDSVGINYLAHGRRIRVNFSSPTARRDFNLLSHGELFGDVAVRLMLQRLSYGPKHPPAEVYLDLPRPKQMLTAKRGVRRP